MRRRPALLPALLLAPLLIGWVRARAATEIPETLATPTGALHGTLELPAGSGPFPVALIIAGSGPTDRNGNDTRLGLDTDCYKLLAQALARHGIASLRYDKRGVGASAAAAPAEDEMRFGTWVTDAAAWGRKLRADGRFSTLTIVGHSEGSLVGMLAAPAIPAQGFVSLAGAGEPIQRVLSRQLEARLAPDAYRQAQTIVRTLAAGHTVARVPSGLAVLFRPSVQPFLISWMRYDPAEEIARLKIPVLIVQGGRDMQVSAADADKLKAADPAATLVLIPHMNHVLKDVGPALADNQRAYTDPKMPLDATLVTAIVRFVSELPPYGGSARAH